MLGRIAKLYYEHNYTHQQIADLLGWNRVRVTRALQEARQQGIVHIRVVSDEPIFVEEEQALSERYGLEHVWVAPSAGGQSSLEDVATVGAQALDQLISPTSQVAVGVSETLAAIAATIRPAETKPNTSFVPLQGTNPGLVTPPTPSNIAEAFAEAFGGRAHALAAPVFTGSAETLKVLEQDPDIGRAFATASASDIALVGVGTVAAGSSIIMRAHLNETDARELRAAGAVGDINARFFDAEGKPVLTERTSLVLGPSLEDFKRIPVRVAAAMGASKVAALRGALRAGLISGLVTDAETSRLLLAD